MARELTEENVRRQESEAGMLTEAKRMVEKSPEIGGPNLLVVAAEGWHRGVVGIVASKLVDAFCKPAIVLAIEDGVAHGSCRSIPAFDMLAALAREPMVTASNPSRLAISSPFSRIDNFLSSPLVMKQK